MMRLIAPEKIGWNLEWSYLELPEIFYAKLNLSDTGEPVFAIINEALGNELGLDVEELQKREHLKLLTGSAVLPESPSMIAQAYAGHQFGHFTMLGDGRAALIGEQISPSGTRFDIQLKGSGQTPYSRGGDGKATLGPMLREYIISEAMHALGIPTTRSLAVIKTDEAVVREKAMPGAVLTRVAASHIRVGTFQYAANWGSEDDLKSLADYTLKRHYPELIEHQNRYLELFKAVIKRQASLIARWQLVGFIHGVMNTDNMTISGETIDYGPCAFMDQYNSKTVFSSIDRKGRYAYGNQPQMAAWNLARFGESLLPLLAPTEDEAVTLAEQELMNFSELFQSYWLQGMGAKLGLASKLDQDQELISSLLAMMEKYGADYTNTFRALTLGKYEELELFATNDFKEWHKLWQVRLKQEASTIDSQKIMQANNPAIIPRNHRVEAALEAAVEQDDYSIMKELVAVLSDPYQYSKEQNEYAKLPDAKNIPYVTYCGT